MTLPTHMSIYARIAFTIFTVGFVINFIETWAFGWNYSNGTLTGAERIWDLISTYAIVLGFVMMLYYRYWGGG